MPGRSGQPRTGVGYSASQPVPQGEARFRNPSFEHFPRLLPVDNIVQRGYMRLLTEVFEFGEAGARINTSDGMVDEALHHDLGAKLDFQFNPDALNRQVNARTDTQLWINQSPTQLMQPGIGDMNFQWAMMFNREAEVQKNYIERHQLTPEQLEGSTVSSLDKWSTAEDSHRQAAASQLGVLADISILDRITGQSISKQQIDYAANRQQRLIDLQIIDPPEEGIAGNTIAEIAGAMGLLDEDNPDNIISANSHNSAFLVPNPIRAVFSKNFMVDGYVNQVTVSYQKFSPEMVPTVALVDISMHAIYVGFARRRSTFTTFLELAAHEQIPSENGGGEDSDGTEIATPDQGVVHELQQAGMIRPVITGIDHSPPTKTGMFGAEEIPDSPWTSLTAHHSLMGANDPTDRYNPSGASSTPTNDPAIDSVGVRVHKGFSFTPISPSDHSSGNTPLGELLHDSQKGFGPTGFDRTMLSCDIHHGLSVRARLKGTQDDMLWLTGSAGDVAGTRVDYTDKGPTPSGGDDGFLDTAERDSVFFGSWPSAQRKMLLGIGYDNICGLTGGATRVNPTTTGDLSSEDKDILWEAFKNQTTGTTGNCFTRSFPITHHHPSAVTIQKPVPAGAVGDLLHMKVHTAEHGDIVISDDGYIFIDNMPKWEETEMKYFIANGFWDKSGSGGQTGANRNDDDYVTFPYIEKNGTGRDDYDLNDENVIYPDNNDDGNAWRSYLKIGDTRHFTVHYQMRVLIKVVLKYKHQGSDLVISNTGWMAVHGRDADSTLMAMGAWNSGGGWGRDRNANIQGNLTGNVSNQGVPHHQGQGGDPTGYPWQTGGDDNSTILGDPTPHDGDIRGYLHFDGMMYGGGGQVHNKSGMTKWEAGHRFRAGASQGVRYIGRTREEFTPGDTFGSYTSTGSKLS